MSRPVGGTLSKCRRRLQWMSRASGAASGLFLLSGCVDSRPSPKEFEEACKTLPPIRSNLPQLYGLDSDKNGIIILNTNSEIKKDLSSYIKNPVIVDKINYGEFVKIRGWKYQKRVIYIYIDDNTSKKDYDPLKSNISKDKLFLGVLDDLYYEYQGFASRQSIDCFSSFNVQVLLERKVR